MKKRILLIEDDVEHCQEYIDYNNEKSLCFLNVAHGCSEGFSLSESFQPDVIILDLMLNKSDGSGIDFIKSIKMQSLLLHPWIVVITAVNSRILCEKVIEMGVEFLISKDKIDYSPKFVFDFIDNTFSDSRKSQCKQNSEEMIKETISGLLDNVGIVHGIDGRTYIIETIYLVLKNNSKSLSSDVYPILSKKYGKSKTAIEQAMRTAIHRAWKNTDLSVLNKNYTIPTSFVSGAPSVKEFVFYYVEKLRA